MYKTAPEEYLPDSLKEVIEAVTSGTFGSTQELTELVDTFRWNNDYYLVAHDFEHYIKAQALVDETYKNKKKWA